MKHITCSLFSKIAVTLGWHRVSMPPSEGGSSDQRHVSDGAQNGVQSQNETSLMSWQNWQAL